LHQEGWNIRFRKVQGEDHVELTFKRRFPVQEGLERAFAKAAQEGFGAASGSQYQAEVEWGYSRQTLSFGKEKNAGSAESKTLALPSAEDAQHLAQEKLPDKLQQWKRKGWAKRVLFDACLYGPVDGWRWYGNHEDIDDKIAIEVWRLLSADKSSNEPIVEISFKKKKYDAQTSVKRQKFLNLLERKNWLLKKDVLKTALILERSRGSC
jgi:hypothetical protein